MSYAQQLLVECFSAGGMDPETAAKAAEIAMATCVAAGIVALDRLDTWEREARIYHLRGQRVTAVVVSIRLQVSLRSVFEATKRHTKRRRAALRTAC